MSNGRYEHATSIGGSQSEEYTDKKMYAGAYSRGWRVFAKDDNGHFWYRIGTYRFTNRTEALVFDRGDEVRTLTSEASPQEAAAAAQASQKAAELIGVSGERRISERASARRQ